MRPPSVVALMLAPAALVSGCASLPDPEAALDRAGTPIAHMYANAADAAGDAYSAARRAAASPSLAPVGTSAVPVSMPGPEARPEDPRAANSLWSPGARNFFNDQRANRIGDILRVEIAIDDSADLSNSSNRQRRGSTEVGVNNFLGLEQGLGRVTPGGFDPGALVNAEGTSTSNGSGAISRTETINLTVAAVVTDVLANGNLVIIGRQQVRVNAELRELTVTGVIRPQDVSADNSVRHDQIAEARVSYGGRGQISVVQRPGFGQRVVDAVSPW